MIGRAIPVGCRDGCGRSMEGEGAAKAAGWSLLPASGRWRCPGCLQALRAVNEPAAAPAGFGVITVMEPGLALGFDDAAD